MRWALVPCPQRVTDTESANGIAQHTETTYLPNTYHSVRAPLVSLIKVPWPLQLVARYWLVWDVPTPSCKKDAEPHVGLSMWAPVWAKARGGNCVVTISARSLRISRALQRAKRNFLWSFGMAKHSLEVTKVILRKYVPFIQGCPVVGRCKQGVFQAVDWVSAKTICHFVGARVRSKYHTRFFCFQNVLWSILTNIFECISKMLITHTIFHYQWYDFGEPKLPRTRTSRQTWLR